MDRSWVSIIFQYSQNKPRHDILAIIADLACPVMYLICLLITIATKLLKGCGCTACSNLFREQESCPTICVIEWSNAAGGGVNYTKSCTDVSKTKLGSSCSGNRLYLLI